MTVAIVHYHLRPGGVTRVIESASRALRAEGIRHIILSGSPSADNELPVVVVDGLDYPPAPSPIPPDKLNSHVRAVATAALGAEPAVWHFHNSSLGKNASIPSLVKRLAEAGEHLVLQIHDLAEDNRPANYALLPDRTRIHPVGPHIRYAFINRRDRDHFITAGLPPQDAHLLPNPLSAPALTQPPHAPPGRTPLIFYPVRGIRRKNLGEILLLAALAPSGTRFAIASAPHNPFWRKTYETWRAFANRHPLPVDFGVVDRLAPLPGTVSTFESWLATCTHLVTTSIAEGFGYTFLDSITLQKPLIGRSIPHLAAEHAEDNIRFPSLYQHLIMPRSWINEAELLLDLETHLQAAYQNYGKALPKDAIDAAWHSLRHPHGYDFANLPEDIQRSCISRCIAEPGPPLVHAEATLIPAREWLADHLTCPRPSPALRSVASCLEDGYGRRLLSLYRSLPASGDHLAWLDSSRLLSLYLDPARFHFLSAGATGNFQSP